MELGFALQVLWSCGEAMLHQAQRHSLVHVATPPLVSVVVALQETWIPSM